MSLKTAAWAIICVFLVLIAFLGWQATNFRVDASADTLLMKENRKYLQTMLAAERYNPDEFILVAFEPSDADIFSDKNLRTVTEISDKLSQIDRVRRTRSIVNVPLFTQVSSLNNIVPEELTWEVRNYSSETMRNSLENHPLYVGLLVNEELSALSIQIVFESNEELSRLQREILDIRQMMLDRDLTKNEAEKLASLEEQYDEALRELNITRGEEIENIRAILAPYNNEGQFYLGGNNLLADQLINIIKSDLLLFGSVITLLVTLVLIFLFRSLFWIFMPVLCCAASVVSTLGLLGLLGIKVTVISANVIALQIILTLAVIIHLIVQYQELQQNNSQSHDKLVLDTIRQKIKPCFYAGLTTSIGFGSLIFSGIQPVISFGWMMVMAVLITLIVSLVLFPACMIAWRDEKQKLVRHKLISRAMSSSARFCLKAPKGILTVSALILVIGIIGSLRLSAENSFIDYFSEDTDVHRELSYIDQNFGGSTPFDVLVDIPVENQHEELLVTADTIQLIEEIQGKLAQETAIGSITSVADFTRIASVVSGKPLTEYELTSLYRLLDSDIQDDLIRPYFDRQNQQLRLATRIKDTTENLDRSELIEQVHNHISDSGLSSGEYQLTNLFVLYQDILDRLVKSQFSTLGLVYAAMAAVLILIFKSVTVATICLIPNIITTAVIFGIMGIFGIPLDLMTLTIAAVAMGISMDDTIHYVHRYQKESGQANSNPIEQSHLSVGYALLYTTAVIVIGFSCLMISNFVPSLLFGLLTSIAMIVALVTDISLLPVLLNRFMKKEVTS